MRHLRYFLFFSGMLFLLTGCRPDYEQVLDNMQATQRLVSAVVHPNYDAIQEAAKEGANMNRIWVMDRLQVQSCAYGKQLLAHYFWNSC